MSKILIIVPAFNEAKNILNVINSLKNENNFWDIIVINDGSSDETGYIANSSGKAFVINLIFNLGIGGAVQTGFKFAYRNGYDIAIQFDGDGQHIASEVNKLLNPIIEGSADVVIGSRFLGKNNGWKSTLSRRIGIKTFYLINYILIKQKITDNTSGFRAYNKRAIKFLSANYPTDYPEPEAVILLGRNGFVINEVFTPMKQREGGKSSIYGIKSAYYMIKVLLSVFFTFVRPKISSKEI